MCKQFQVSLNIVQQLLVKKVSVYSFKLFTCQIPLFVLSKKQNVVLVMAYVSWTRHSSYFRSDARVSENEILNNHYLSSYLNTSPNEVSKTWRDITSPVY